MQVADATDAHGASVTLISHHTWELLAATDAVSRSIDDVQFTLGEGPSLDTSRTAREILVPDLSEASTTCRWPIAAGELSAAGVGSVFTFPVDVVPTGTTMTVLTLYRRSRGLMVSDELRAARRYATVIATATGLDWGDFVRAEAGKFDADQIGAALAATPPPLMVDRAEIHTAAGIAAAQLGVAPSEALVVLRAHSYRTNTALPDLARHVVETRELPI